MSIQINSFMGKLGWYARTHFPNLASDAYLKLQFFTRSKAQKKYVDYFMNGAEVPQPNVVNIETINRCNSTCEFCTANVNAEKRPLRKIDDALYYSIIERTGATRDTSRSTATTSRGSTPVSWSSTSMRERSSRTAISSCRRTAFFSTWRSSCRSSRTSTS